MKDITRIHIAKIAYSIEIDAKKLLEKYLTSLETYIEDKEVLNDIEIRITELLAEHGVKPDGVITIADVDSVRTQLGDPKDFIGDDDTTDAIADIEHVQGTGRKLYRNLDTALVGGVLGGVASYIGVNAVWVRLAFIVLTLFSFGFMILLYILLWLLLPAARTAAERLQMQGVPVTLSSIRELNESSPAKDYKHRAWIIKRIITLTFGVTSSIAALMTIGFIISLWLSTLFVMDGKTYWRFAVSDGYETTSPLSVGLAFGSGILLVLLFVLAAYGFFAQRFNKRIWVSGIIIIVLGIASITAAYGTAWYQRWQFDEQIRQNTVETSVKIPAGFESITSMNIDIPTYSELSYVADNPTGSITLRSGKGQTINASVVDKVLTVSGPDGSLMTPSGNTTITIHGPELTSITSNNGDITYITKNQKSLTIEGHNDTVIRTGESSISDLTAVFDGAGRLLADGSSLESVVLDLSHNSYAILGNITQLSLTTPEACGTDAPITVSVQSIKNSTLTYNGQTQPSLTFEKPCFNLLIEPSRIQN